MRVVFAADSILLRAYLEVLSIIVGRRVTGSRSPGIGHRPMDFARQQSLAKEMLACRSPPLCLPKLLYLPSPPGRRGVNWKKRRKQIQRLYARYGKDRSLVREFPDLKVEQRTAPCTNGMRGSTARRVQPPGMKQFPVGHSHKQGLELITPGTDPQWMGGKKP
jgi:hypothetical protein